MSKPSRAVILVLWVVSLVVAAEWGAKAQQNPSGLVLSGADVGFRVEGQNGGKPYGSFVVKMNGQWVEITGGFGKAVPATVR